MQPTLTERMGRGAAGGAVAGAAFAGLEAWNAISHDLPVRAPFLAISTILLGEDRVITGPSAQMIGLVIHFAMMRTFLPGQAAGGRRGRPPGRGIGLGMNLAAYGTGLPFLPARHVHHRSISEFPEPGWV